MAVKNFRTGGVSVTVRSRAQVHSQPKSLPEAPGGLYPLRMSVWNTDEYRIANGWPVVVPDYDVRARSLVSAEGEVLAGRESARSITTGAMVRWIADDDYFDLTSLQWYPYQAEYPLIWSTASDYAPTFISDYEYQNGAEIFLKEALNFDADGKEHLWTNINEALGGAGGYSVVMTLSLNSVYGNNQITPSSGLWCPGQPTPVPGQPITEPPSGGWVSLTLQGHTLYLETDQTRRKKALSISDLVTTASPITVAMVVDRPYVTVYAGRGTSSISSATLDIGNHQVAMDGRVVLGRTNGDTDHAQDMALLDLGLYSDVLTPHQVRDEFALMSGVYGGDL